MPEPTLQIFEPQIDESKFAYPGWKTVLASFFGVMVSFAAIVPYTFGLFIKPLAASFGGHPQDSALRPSHLQPHRLALASD